MNVLLRILGLTHVFSQVSGKKNNYGQKEFEVWGKQNRFLFN